MLIQKPIYFEYPAAGVRQKLIIQPEGEWLPMKPLVTAMGMKWETQRTALAKHPSVQQVKIRGQSGLPALCMLFCAVPDYLLGISTGRVRDVERVRYFQRFFPAVLERVAAETETETVGDGIECEKWDEGRIKNHIGQAAVYIGRPLDRTDHLIKDLVAVGVRDYEVLKWYSTAAYVDCLKLNPTDKAARPKTYPVSTFTYNAGELLRRARHGQYPEPLFYAKHPNLYEQKVIETYAVPTADGSLPPGIRTGRTKLEGIDLSRVFRPHMMKPWFSDKYADYYRNLDSVMHEVWVEEFNRKLTECLDSGMAFSAAYKEARHHEPRA
ncbi:hypothetical protein V9W64_10595 [Neisseria leonii]|uniref:Phage antirepressor N-terminal domain-containing protein n=1 Tax=Neisseria leonii TaxID=2995413 RepID=A0A9X4IEL5_9NEIS|nr:hypothetical protein [Neisseria sp. 51.81]MDD9328228.1 phage antirepressor N-terminal domain-containing protein [Neisseria sp. 51.81]